MDSAIRVALLGPMEVHGDEGAVAVVGSRLQGLLALLALAAPRVVSSDRLIDELWGDEQPTNPANALQALVSRLRRMLGADVAVRQDSGYALRIDPDVIDAVRLERLVAEGREAVAAGLHEAATDRFRAALRLVRGPPLATLLDSWFARDARTRLDEVVVAAHEGLIEGELSMGRHADVLGTLVDLVQTHPMHERFRAQLIVTLYRSGRQADALQAYRDAREYLLDELGLDPGPELQRLERSVLAQDPAIATPIGLSSSLLPTPALPTALTSFVGRRAAIDDVHRAVAASRLTTVVGPGGVGKSRLVMEVAATLAERGEVWYVELAPITRADSIGETVAVAVGAKERTALAGQPPVTPEQRIAERFGTRRVVVVLDNCEHLAEGASSCAVELLAACQGLRIVATSREPLGIEGERQLLLGPLNDDEATELFVDRARAVQPLFVAGERDAELLELCRHLDGLPLAIELAAARAKTLPVPEIADRLRSRFKLLRRTQRSGTSRHEGLEAAIDWSYGLLFEDERTMFCQLAVFTGGATIDAVERVCGQDAFDVASRLVDRSLLMADTAGREVRFNMLESLRDYGIERLEESGTLRGARDAHLRWCVEQAERVDHGIRGADQLQWLTSSDDDHDNMRAALGHALEHDTNAALRLIAALTLAWWMRGRRRETRGWIEACLDADGGDEPRLRARVLARSGLVAEPASVRDPARADLHAVLLTAEERLRAAIGISTGLGAESDAAFAKLLLLMTLCRGAPAGEAVDRAELDALLVESTNVFEAGGDDFCAGLAWVTDAILCVVLGDLSRARASVSTAAGHVQRSGDRFAASQIEYVRGMLDELAGESREAYRHIEQSLRLLDELGLDQAVTAQARFLGTLAGRGGEHDLAAQWHAFVDERNDGWMHYDGSVIASARNQEGLAARTMGELLRAAAAHTDALDWYTRAAMPAGVAFTQSCLGFLVGAQGDRATAARHHVAALDAATAADDESALALALEGCAGSLLDVTAGAQLLGAAARMRSTSSGVASTPPSHRADVAHIEDQAARALGVEAFAAGRRSGGQLGRSAAVALARRASSQSPTPA
jgi:predicted ATPase/DNA-binding SARP family transcriptional activator